MKLIASIPFDTLEIGSSILEKSTPEQCEETKNAIEKVKRETFPMRMKTLLKTMNRVTDKRHHRAVAPDREAILDAARRTIANAPPPNASNRAPSRF